MQVKILELVINVPPGVGYTVLDSIALCLAGVAEGPGSPLLWWRKEILEANVSQWAIPDHDSSSKTGHMLDINAQSFPQPFIH